jgi:hypothetical protein
MLTVLVSVVILLFLLFPLCYIYARKPVSIVVVSQVGLLQDNSFDVKESGNSNTTKISTDTKTVNIESLHNYRMSQHKLLHETIRNKDPGLPQV